MAHVAREPGSASYTPNRSLNGVQFKLRTKVDEDTGRPQHHIMATIGRQKLGTLWWDKEHGEIGGIGVVPAMKHKGLATEMYHVAHRMSQDSMPPKQMEGQGQLFTDRKRVKPPIVAPRHSEVRTSEGDKFAKSVGGEVPPIRRAAWR